MTSSLFYIHLLILFFSCKASLCSRDVHVGASSPQRLKDKVDSGRGLYIMPRRSEYLVSCCGVVTEWQGYILKPGTIRYQIWRASGNGEYELMGENLATYNRGEENNMFELKVDVGNQIPVKEGDFIGWFNENESMVAYQREKNGLGALVYYNKTSADIASFVDWSAVKSSEPRSYAVRATISKAEKPKFKNLNSGISLVDDIVSGLEIYKLAFEGAEYVSLLSEFTVSLDMFSENFAYNQSTKVVYVTNVPEYGKYSLDFTVQDHCGNTDTGTLKVDVKSKLPNIVNLPTSVSVREDVQNEELMLLAINVIHTSSIICEIKSVSPSSGRHYFLVRNMEENPPEIYLKATADLDYDLDDSYEVSIKCSAGKSSDTESLYINVQQNKAPVFTNLPVTIDLHADINVIGEPIYHVMWKDEENNPVQFTLSCEPQPCPFNITRGGTVLAVNDIRKAVSRVFYIKLMIEDDFNSVGPEFLIVNISGLNQPPFIYNLPDKTTVILRENSPPMTPIFQVLAVDQDINDTLTFSLTVKPSNMIPLFTINETSGEVFAVSPFNFESLKSRSIRLYPTVSDGMEFSEGYLKVSVIDINEEPEFQYKSYTVYTGENKKGFPVAKGLIKAIDLDKNDVITYGLDCGVDTPMLSINTKNSDIYQEYELDVDKLGTVERTIICNVSAADKFGMVSYASLKLIIADENDNAPLFERTSYLFVATRDLPPFSVIGQALASDLDSIPVNRRLSYSISDDTEEFIIDDNGTLYLTKDLMATTVGTVYKYNVRVDDGGKGKDSVLVTVVVLPGDYSSLSLSLMVEELTFFSLQENVAWFVTALHLGLVLLILVIYISARYVLCNNTAEETIDMNKQAFEEISWNNLNNTGTHRLSSVSANNEYSGFLQQQHKKIRSMSLSSIPESNVDTILSKTGAQKLLTSVSQLTKRTPEVVPRSTPSARRDSVVTTSAGLHAVQSRVSLSEIEPATSEPNSFTWQPWSVADFNNTSGDDKMDEKTFSSSNRRLSHHQMTK